MNKLPKKLTRSELLVFVCQGSDCKKGGSKKLRKRARKYLREKDFKKRSLVVKTKCMDGCKRGPICHIQPTDTWLAGPSKEEFYEALDMAIETVDS